MPCTFKDCYRPVRSRGLCQGHYVQQLAGKELNPLQQQYHGLSELERFEKRISKRPWANDCWWWLGAIQRSSNRPKIQWYGQWRNGKGVHELTHRAAWRMYRGDIPAGLFVLHHCDHPRCVNPDHLYLGTQTDNMRDMWDRGRARPGTRRGEAHGSSKLTEKNVREIRASEETGLALAKRFNVKPTTIYDIRNRKSWKHIK